MSHFQFQNLSSCPLFARTRSRVVVNSRVFVNLRVLVNLRVFVNLLIGVLRRGERAARLHAQLHLHRVTSLIRNSLPLGTYLSICLGAYGSPRGAVRLHAKLHLYRVTSRIRNRHPVRPYSRTMPRLLCGPGRGGAFSYERGTPVPRQSVGDGCTTRVLEMIGASKGNSTKCPLLRSFKGNRMSHKFTCISTDYPFHDSGVVGFRVQGLQGLLDLPRGGACP